MDAEILDWYTRLPNRVLDLIGDYAGNERFLLEGDSLLLHCFGDSKIDFEDGFQLLHAVYAVEAFLETLVRRLCNFHIVFFSEHKALCVPYDKSHLKNFYLLARSIMIRHLECHLPRSHPEIELHTFTSINDADFGKYLESSGIYFVMCHDGAHAQAISSKKDEVLDTSKEDWPKVAFRKIIRYFIGSGFNIALINGLEIRDTKVMAIIVEGRRDVIQYKVGEVVPNVRGFEDCLSTEMAKTSLGNLSNSLAEFQKFAPEQCELPDTASNSSKPLTDSRLSTERCELTVFILSQLLKHRPERAPLASAFLLHAITLTYLPLSMRRLRGVELMEESKTDQYRSFLNDFALVAGAVVDLTCWKQEFNKRGLQCDIADLVDGRLFKMILSSVQGRKNARELLPKDIVQDFSYSANTVRVHCGVELDFLRQHDVNGEILKPPRESANGASILPFSNAVFDQHLMSININVDVRDMANFDTRSSRIIKEVSHWHNSKSLDRKKLPRIRNDKEGQRKLRANQRYMDEMMKYAASLTNAVGKILDPQTITVTKENKTSSSAPSVNPKKVSTAHDAKKVETKGKVSMNRGRELVQATLNSKRDAFVDKTFTSWATVRAIIDKLPEPEERYRKVCTYLNDLSEDKARIIDAEVTLYSIQCLLEVWAAFCRAKQAKEGYKVVAVIWYQLRHIWEGKGLTEEILNHTRSVCRLLGLPTSDQISATTTRSPLTFTFRAPQGLTVPLAISLPPMDFQLVHCGPYMDRNMESQPDPRVPFKPDGWQRTVLDELDAHHSVFVVAPTSAGKTFISFYAMEKILRADNDGVLVYVAPTKALVNQIAAEVQARFSKIYPHAGKSVWAIHTRDYRVNNPAGCQILVTVPHILQIMLLAPSNAKTWAPRVKCIIFDEIHSIGQAEDGVVWEQLLLLAPCPIIALSATVGNPEQFRDWLVATQRSSGFVLTMIQHHHRYSDLRKFIYHPSKTFKFGGLRKKSTLGDVGLDNISSFSYFHPVASLVNRSRGMPADLSFEPRDCLTLWQAMCKYQTTKYPVPERLDPTKALPKIVRKADIIGWEYELKKILAMWLSDPGSPFDNILAELSLPTESQSRPPVYFDNKYIQNTALSLIADLHERNALPAILFNFDRSSCEQIARKILEGLEKAEDTWKQESPKWKSLMDGYEKWQEAKKAKASRPVKVKKKSGGDNDDERVSKLDKQRESGETDVSPFETFDPDAPWEDFSFADVQKIAKSEMDTYFRQLEWKGVANWLLVALKRGIGIHHAGMNRKYRQIVEILFRRGYLRVVIATGTLALGINMPCKTVVFSGDSVYLTALNFRQCAGRAGRRGFDILGNVAFHGIPFDKACRLLSSRLPDLNGHFPITTTLVLRLFTLLHDSKNSAYARRAINSLLSQPRLYLGGESFKDQVLHHLRFSIEYLRRQQLIGPAGEPINFTSCVTHLYFTENSSFAFHALLKGGYFHYLCSNIKNKPKATLRQLMVVMSHLFGRRSCRQSDIEDPQRFVGKSSSIVFLPKLPKLARKILEHHNQETLETFTTYVKTFAEQHVKGDDHSLPLTGVTVSGSHSSTIAALNTLPATLARSHFVALSGHSDTFTSVDDLCSSTRSGIFLEKAVIPHIDIFSEAPLNAYLYDFFMHGAIEPLEIANKIRKGDIWFLLNDFSLVLATLTTSLESFLNVSPTEDEGMLDVMGQGDIMEEEKDEVVELETSTTRSSTPVSLTAPLSQQRPRTATAVPDAWDISDSDDEKTQNAGKASEVDSTDATLWDGSDDESEISGNASDEGLMSVLQAFQMLKAEFDGKFKAMWA